MDSEAIGAFLDANIVNFRGAQWRPHFVFPQNYLKLLVTGMEKTSRDIDHLDIKGSSYAPQLTKSKVAMKIALDKAKRSRFFDHIEFMSHMNEFYVEVRSFIEVLWRLRLQKEI
jgi:hypothetical protein